MRYAEKWEKYAGNTCPNKTIIHIAVNLGLLKKSKYQYRAIKMGIE